jgi:Homeodomain-like domain
MTMSERDLQRIQVLCEVMNRVRTPASAAVVLALSTRQVHRLLKAYRLGGAGSLVHRARGRPSNNRIRDDVRDRAVQLVRAHYPDFGPTLAAEMLAERHELKVSRETLRGWMTEAGLWLSRKQRRSFHQPRLRREALGELVQIDGSEHRWFEDRAEPPRDRQSHQGAADLVLGVLFGERADDVILAPRHAVAQQLEDARRDAGHHHMRVGGRKKVRRHGSPMVLSVTSKSGEVPDRLTPSG